MNPHIKGEAVVLHVDDDADVRDLSKTFIESQSDSLQVITAASGEEALELLEDNTTIECVVSDYNMPQMNGLEFFEKLQETYPSMPFILYTGKGSEEIAERAINKGVSDYMQKELGTAQYATLINRIEREVRLLRSQAEIEKRLQALESAKEGICILDTDGTFRYANEAYQDIYGYTDRDLIGKSWTELHPDDEVKVIKSEVLPTVAEDGEWSGLSYGLSTEGTTFPEQKTIGKLPGGELVIVVERADRTPSVS